MVTVYSIKRKIPHICLLGLSVFSLINSNTFAQYSVNGFATEDNCHCFTLTPDTNLRAGSAWNYNRIDLSKSFTFTFNIYAGCVDDRGADGMAFVLQNTNLKSLGDTGRGLGFQGISPSVGITLDNYQNLYNKDPAYDHIAIQINGDVNHNTSNNIAGPVQTSATSANIEDCNWHLLKVNWDAAVKKIDVYFDGSLRLSLNKDFVADVFSGNPVVYWGFTGATGGYSNIQKVCNQLSSGFRILSTQKRCVGESIRFFDSSFVSGFVKRYWNFGDESPIDSVSVNPVHTYTSANNYQVSLTVKSIDGCFETKVKIIKIGTDPVANFTVKNACQENLALIDSSYTDFGTINSWYWNFNDGRISTQQNPIADYSTTGSKRISFAVKTAEGCTSDTIYKNVIVDKTPLPEMSFKDECKNSVINFKATDSARTNVSQWYWSFGDNKVDSGAIIKHVYSASGNYLIQLFAETKHGCFSATKQKIINIYGTDANAGNDIIAAAAQPVQLHATGGTSYKWSPSTGLNNPNIANPIAVVTYDQSYYLKATTPEGCESYDTVSIKIYKGP